MLHELPPPNDGAPLHGRWTTSGPLLPDDLPFLYRLVVDPEVGVTLRYQGATPGFDDFARHAWDGVLGQWIVRAANSGEPLGVVVVASADFRNGYAFLSVIARPSVLGSGVMMDGVASVLDHAFSCWPFRQLYFEASDDNFAQFVSGLGRFFVEEGCRREQLFSRNRYQDVHLLTLTRTAWETEGAPLWHRLSRVLLRLLRTREHHHLIRAFLPASESGAGFARDHGRVTTPRTRWQAAFETSPAREADFSTMSGIPVDAVYGPDDAEFPGEYPYTRGPYASMYRSKLWTMRMFAGFGTAIDTNRRFHELLAAGGDGLSTAFDLPTLMGRDSDDALALGEVGKCGVAVDTIADVEDLYRGIDLGSVTTSMTINGPAAIVFAMFVANAEATGVPRRAIGGTLQNDILKEYQAQKEFIFPPRPSLRLVRDTITFCTAEMPKWHTISVSGYHIREAGSTAAQELAFTLANGFAYVELGRAAGLDVDAFAPRLSFFFNAHVDFFEEIAKYRAARRIWARWMHDRYGARSERSLQLRFHTQTAGVSLTAQQPEVNIVRTAIEALAGVLGGTQSLHTNSMDETLALPTEKAARIALRTQQVIANETRVANVADPLGGSYYVEALTDEMERRAEALFAQLDELGAGSMLDGAVRGVEEGWFQQEIAEAAYELERKLNRGQHIVVGVNGYLEGNDEPPPPTLRIGPEVEEEQRRRLEKVRHDRDGRVVEAALARVRADAAIDDVNLMPALLDAARSHATLGEIVEALASVFGRWVEAARF